MSKAQVSIRKAQVSIRYVYGDVALGSYDGGGTKIGPPHVHGAAQGFGYTMPWAAAAREVQDWTYPLRAAGMSVDDIRKHITGCSYMLPYCADDKVVRCMSAQYDGHPFVLIVEVVAAEGVC